MITDPFSTGADHEISISCPLLDVTGALGYSGGTACRIVMISELYPKPTEFWASIVNS